MYAELLAIKNASVEEEESVGSENRAANTDQQLEIAEAPVLPPHDEQLTKMKKELEKTGELITAANKENSKS